MITPLLRPVFACPKFSLWLYVRYQDHITNKDTLRQSEGGLNIGILLYVFLLLTLVNSM